MARSSKTLGHGRLAVAGTDTVTKQDGLTSTCQRINLYNTHTSRVYVDIYYLRNGETTSSNGAFLERVYIESGKTKHAFNSEGTVLDGANDKLAMIPSVGDVVDYNVFGTEE